MINENWARWLQASCTTYFDNNRGSFPMDFEGAERVKSKTESDYCEFRFNGPDIYQLGRNEYKLKITINVLIHHIKADTADFYTPSRSIGTMTQAFALSIPAYKYGTPGDDSLLGCMLRTSELRINSFGQIDKVTRAIQSTIEADYEIYLEGEE